MPAISYLWSAIIILNKCLRDFLSRNAYNTCVLDDVLKMIFQFQSTRCALRCPGYDRHFYFALLCL